MQGDYNGDNPQHVWDIYYETSLNMLLLSKTLKGHGKLYYFLLTHPGVHSRHKENKSTN